MSYVPPYSPSLPDWQRQVSTAVNTIFPKLANVIDVVADYGADPTGGSDSTTAIQTSINAAADLGAVLVFPPGVFQHTGLTFKNKVQYRGAGKDINASKGTALIYTGTGDGVQINNPVNSSTPANIVIEGISFKSLTRSAGKAAFADTGSSFLEFRSCAFMGADHQLILDQSELVTIFGCDFEANATGATSGLWIVNAAQRTSGANADFTNRVGVYECQFNSSLATSYGILDYGGYCHSFINNNYNGCLTHVYACGVEQLQIIGGEWESSTGPCLKISDATPASVSMGACTGTSVHGGFMSPGGGQHAIVSTSGSLEVGGGLEFSTSVAGISGTGNMFDYVRGWVLQRGTGTVDDGYGTNTRKFMLMGAAAPTTGSWIVGDIVFNNAPAAAGKIGWVCTTAGSPGTWKAFGAIDA